MDDDDRVELMQKKRFRYTRLEERKMWHFFARELKAGNEDALRKRPKLWELYEQTENTTKKMSGLESHFRKHMRPKIHKCDLDTGDLFLLLRFFKIRLNPAQKRTLEENHECTIEDEGGTFMRARVEFGPTTLFYPTAEQEETILSATRGGPETPEGSEDDDDDDTTQLRTARTIRSSDEELSVRQQQQRQLSDDSDDSDVQFVARVGPETPELNVRERLNEDEDNVGNQSLLVHHRTNDNVDPDETPPLDHSTPLREILQLPTNPGNEDDDIVQDPQPSTSAVRKRKPAPSASVDHELAMLKQHFFDGSQAFFEGTMDKDTFMEPFIHMFGGKYQKHARNVIELFDRVDRQNK